MRIVVFTGNQPRHNWFLNKLNDHLYHYVMAVQECRSQFAGTSSFWNNTKTVRDYFKKMRRAEHAVFDRKLPTVIAMTIPLEFGDLNKFDINSFPFQIFDADLYIVFGSSYIKGELCDFLIKKRAINIHMGVSPMYAGNSCNFWALYDQRPDYVGATIQRLSHTLDQGNILAHVLPHARCVNGFSLGMYAVRGALEYVIDNVQNFENMEEHSVPEIDSTTTRRRDFNDETLNNYKEIPPKKICSILRHRDGCGRDRYNFINKQVI